MSGKKKFSFVSVILSVICVVFVCEAAAPAAAIGNQQFFWATPEEAARLAEGLGCEPMAADDPSGTGRGLVRFVTSWATPQNAVAEAITFARSVKE